jgi:galactokinase/galacturonokinase
VGECQLAAQLLGEKAGIPDAQILSDVPLEQFYQYRNNLLADFRKRAAHYYSEIERVDRGKVAWEQGDMANFGELMNASCHSSITQYESGSEPIIRLHEIVSGISGVLGSRFGGGGYGGCVIGLVEREKISQVAAEVRKEYLTLYPDKKNEMLIFTAENEGGVRMI